MNMDRGHSCILQLNPTHWARKTLWVFIFIIGFGFASSTTNADHNHGPYFFGQETQDHNFVERDRLQSGLTCTVILIQSDIKGGSMHTINFAKKQNRNICAMKPLNDRNFLGNKKIIDEGLATEFSSYSELKIISFI